MDLILQIILESPRLSSLFSLQENQHRISKIVVCGYKDSPIDNVMFDPDSPEIQDIGDTSTELHTPNEVAEFVLNAIENDFGDPGEEAEESPTPTPVPVSILN